MPADASTEPARPADNEIPYLPRGVRLRHCPLRDGWFLLAPERSMKLDGIGSAILTAVDGQRTFADVVAKLAADVTAPADLIAKDSRAFLAQLMQRRMVEAR